MTIPATGDILPTLEIDITRADLIRYAGAADDYVPQHWDHPFMLASGFPDVIVHGWLTFSHMCRAVTDHLCLPQWQMAGFAVRYLRPTFPGVLVCGGHINSIESGVCSLSLWAKDAEGAVTTVADVRMRRAGSRDRPVFND